MGRVIRWQAMIVFLGIALVAAILASTAHQFTSVTVPATGGVYTEAAVGSVRAINPLLSYSSDVDRDLNGLIFQGLVSLNERGEVEPALAERWEISPDQREYTFHLRRDVRWHDGAPFTAADVIYTIGVLQSDAFMAEDFPAPSYLSKLWRSVTVEQADDFTVRFRLQQPYSPFLAENTIGILPAHLWRNVPVSEMPRSLYNQQPVGTGPWRLAELTATSARLTPNPYWHGARPYLEAIELKFYPDYASAFTAFTLGEAQGVSRILPQDLPAAQASKDMAVYSAPLAGESLIYFNLTNPNKPFLADKQVRQALQLALDVPKLIDQSQAGQGVPASGLFMPGTWAYAGSKPTAPDPLGAAQMLQDAGWVDSDGDGVRDKEGVPLSFSLLGDNETLLHDIAEQWRAIGVQAKPEVVSLLSLAAEHLSPRDYEAAVVHWLLSEDPDPYPLWHSTQVGDGQNYTGWNNRRADEIMEEARSVADPGRRIQLYHEFQQIFADELPALPLYFDVYSYGVSNQVRDVQVGRLNVPSDRFRTADRWYIVTQRVTMEPGGSR